MICKTMKKGLLAAGLGAMTLGLLFGTHAPSYVKTAFHKARQHAKGAVPVEFEIDRARQEIAALEPAIRENIQTLARAQVDVEYLNRDLVNTRENLDREGKTIVALKEMAEKGNRLTSGTTTYTAEEVQRDLASKLDHFRQGKRLVAEKEATLKLREQAVRSAREQLKAMSEAREALRIRIESIETRLKQIRAAEAGNEFNFDDSELARAKQTVNELEKSLDVMAKVAEEEGRYAW